MQTLRRWGEKAGIAVFWEACPQDPPHPCIDWRNQHSGQHDGNFDEALAWLLRGHGEAEPHPVAIRSGNGTVRILADDSGARLR